MPGWSKARDGRGCKTLLHYLSGNQFLAVGADKKSVRLKLDPLTKGHVHAIGAPGLRSTEGTPLLHPTGYYTLNEIPK
jgi:hypothetical protein